MLFFWEGHLSCLKKSNEFKPVPSSDCNSSKYLHKVQEPVNLSLPVPRAHALLQKQKSSLFCFRFSLSTFPIQKCHSQQLDTFNHSQSDHRINITFKQKDIKSLPSLFIKTIFSSFIRLY